ncbi:hypothetical protein [Simplicispira suum]|jgi:hypothetical protein|uniref:UrcA family protein n=1 Tax=Simplicispira suum TaxID=2109915 RepID=A0A2S0N3R0_9BURK|nr:hypothetical protein [Simplicispira suum]AVO42782.1 hypothetical protein C6571_17095 [Simplicispira suum]MBW7833057.1 hypothetical protein [Simplicispira suum]
MQTSLRTRNTWLAPLIFTALLAVPGFAVAQNYEASLERGSHPDTTPEQRYQTAIREAGGGLKLALAACREQAADRKNCEREARANYKDDMAYARELRRNPDARPTSIRSGIESTEVTTIRVIPAK